MKKTLKRLCTGFLALATVVTAYRLHPFMQKVSNTGRSQKSVLLLIRTAIKRLKLEKR